MSESIDNVRRFVDAADFVGLRGPLVPYTYMSRICTTNSAHLHTSSSAAAGELYPMPALALSKAYAPNPDPDKGVVHQHDTLFSGDRVVRSHAAEYRSSSSNICSLQRSLSCPVLHTHSEADILQGRVADQAVKNAEHRSVVFVQQNSGSMVFSEGGIPWRE